MITAPAKVKSFPEELFGNAIQILMPAQEQLIAGNGRGSVDAVVEDVGRQDFELIRVLDHDAGAIAAN
jgi:hypothetical protein